MTPRSTRAGHIVSWSTPATQRPSAEPTRSLGSSIEGTNTPVSSDDFGAVLDRDQLERGFERLSVDHRAVLVLHYLLDMAPEQVAQVPRHPSQDRLRPPGPSNGGTAWRLGGGQSIGVAAHKPTGRGAIAADHQMGPILRSWLKDTTVAPPNARNSVSQVMDRLPQASSQRRWRLPSFRTGAPTPLTTDRPNTSPVPSRPRTATPPPSSGGPHPCSVQSRPSPPVPSSSPSEV